VIPKRGYSEDSIALDVATKGTERAAAHNQLAPTLLLVEIVRQTIVKQLFTYKNVVSKDESGIPNERKNALPSHQKYRTFTDRIGSRRNVTSMHQSPGRTCFQLESPQKKLAPIMGVWGSVAATSAGTGRFSGEY